jgi:hypothetical protein
LNAFHGVSGFTASATNGDELVVGERSRDQEAHVMGVVSPRLPGRHAKANRYGVTVGVA